MPLSRCDASDDYWPGCHNRPGGAAADPQANHAAHPTSPPGRDRAAVYDRPVGVEIERKFLLSAAPDWLADCECSQIEQGYLALEPDVEVRVRRRDGADRLTVKRGSGREREEVEVELDLGQLEQLWPLTEGRRVRKLRYLVPFDAGTAEVDVYRGAHAGLITAEVEFDTATEAERVELPGWLGREITGEPAYANRVLAVDGLPAG